MDLGGGRDYYGGGEGEVSEVGRGEVLEVLEVLEVS